MQEAAEEFHTSYVPFLQEQRRDIEEKRQLAVEERRRHAKRLQPFLLAKLWIDGVATAASAHHRWRRPPVASVVVSTGTEAAGRARACSWAHSPARMGCSAPPSRQAIA